MKAFDRIAAALVLLIALMIAGFNIFLSLGGESGRQYRVDAARAAAEIESGIEPDPDDYPSLTAIVPVGEDESVLLGGHDDYLIREAGGRLYRFDYSVDDGGGRMRSAVNIAMAAMAAAVLITLAVVRARVLKPFNVLRNVPYELSKGNLSVPINENRHRLFGRFTWGLNMLRDNLELQKRHELELQAEKKKMIISLSHDIKIPLSAIKLYAKALEKGMYDAERSIDAASKINERADEIEGYVAEIVKASNEEFLPLQTREGEFYLSEIIEPVKRYYTDKLRPLGTAFEVTGCENCLLRGDPDRAVEVLQNIIENAIKYGDGRRITVSSSDEEDCRLIAVTNTGCALPPDELPHIFDSFYRGSNAGGKDGSGLGLYICQTLMRKMNGDIFASCGDGEITVTAVFRKV